MIKFSCITKNSKVDEGNDISLYEWNDKWQRLFLGICLHPTNFLSQRTMIYVQEKREVTQKVQGKDERATDNSKCNFNKKKNLSNVVLKCMRFDILRWISV